VKKPSKVEPARSKSTSNTGNPERVPFSAVNLPPPLTVEPKSNWVLLCDSRLAPEFITDEETLENVAASRRLRVPASTFKVPDWKSWKI